jgi:tetratricopeptide (TPR) repeat protein
LAILGSIQLTQYIRTNDPKVLCGALASLLEAASGLPGDPSIRSNFSLALYYSGDGENALKESSKALQMDPTRAKTRYVLGMILAAQSRYDESAFHLKTAASEIPAAKELLERVEQLARESSAVAQK